MTKQIRFFYCATFTLWVCILAWILIGCAGTFSQQAYKSLDISKTSYNATLSAAGDMYDKGQIDEAAKNKFIEYGDVYMTVHNEATEALLDYKMASLEDKPEAKENYLGVADRLAKRLADLVAFLGKVKGGTK